VEGSWTISRRQALKVGGLGALTLAGVGGLLGSGPAEGAERNQFRRIPQPGPADLRQNTFKPLVGSRFTLQSGTESHELILSEVREHPTARPGQGECFSLLFKAPSRVVGSGTYDLTHHSLGRFGMFISPVGAPATGARYEAVVNRSS
jgi:hypothetical protein